MTPDTPSLPDEVALKACPFCDEALVYEDSAWVHRGPDHRCIADPIVLQDEDDIDAWNTRAALEASPLRELVEALKNARVAVATLDEAALGYGEIAPQYEEDHPARYPLRDELLSNIDSALRKAGEEV